MYSCAVHPEYVGMACWYRGAPLSLLLVLSCYPGVKGIFCGINTVFISCLWICTSLKLLPESSRPTASSCFRRPRTLVVAGSAFQDGVDSNQVSCRIGGRVGEDLESPPSSRRSMPRAEKRRAPHSVYRNTRSSGAARSHGTNVMSDSGDRPSVSGCLFTLLMEL